MDLFHSLWFEGEEYEEEEEEILQNNKQLKVQGCVTHGGGGVSTC